MDSLDAITLIAFLAALMRLDSGLPPDLQHQLNEIGKAFPSDISKLDAIAESYSPLDQEYMEARLALQQKEGERLRFSVPELEDSSEIGDEQIINFAVDVFQASDSVNLLKQKAQESTRLGQLLFQLRRQTSFMVKDDRNIPEEEKWLFSNPTAWDALERGLRQAAAGEVHDLGDFSQYADLEIED